MNFMFILYALIIYVITNGIGKLFVQKENKLYILRSLIGFCVLLFGLQLLYYPIQLMQLSSNFVFLISSLVIIFGLFIGIKNTKKEDFFFLKKWEFYALLILIFWIIKIIPTTEAGDDWFYMPLIMDNADIDSINTIQPRSGWDWNVAELWKYQGFYLFTTFFYQIQSILSSGVEAIFVSFRSAFSLIMIAYSSIVITYTERIFKQKNNIVIALVKWASIVLISFLDWSHIYWGSFAVLPIFFPLIIILLNEYSKNPSKSLTVMIAIINGAMLSLFSSALFLNVFLIYSYLAANLWRGKVNFKDYLWMGLPTLIYFSFFIGYPIFIVPIICLYFFIYNCKLEKLDYIINQYFKYFILFLPIAFAGLTLALGMKFTWSYYRLGYTFLIFNVMVCMVIGYCILKKKVKVEPVLYAFLFFNLTFFNPLVCPIIARFFTTDEVYYRLFYITKNPMILAFIFCFLYEVCSVKKVFDIVYKVGLSLICIYYSFFIMKSVDFEIGYSSEYNYLLRENKDSLKLGEYLYSNKELKGSYAWSIYFEPRQYDTSYKANVIRYPDAVNEKDIMLKAMYAEKEVDQSSYIEFKNNLQKQNVDLLITYNNEVVKERLKDITNIIYENNTFTLYSVNIK